MNDSSNWEVLIPLLGCFVVWCFVVFFFSFCVWFMFFGKNTNLLSTSLCSPKLSSDLPVRAQVSADSVQYHLWLVALREYD